MAKKNIINGIEIFKLADIQDNVRSMFNVLHRAKESMINPRMMHYVAEIDQVNLFPKRFIQAFKEIFKSEWKINEKKRKKRDCGARKRGIPDLEIIYSVESKLIERDDGSGELAPYRFNHIHIMLIVDIGYGRYGKKEINHIVNCTLNRIQGLEIKELEDDFSIGFLKFRKHEYMTAEYQDLYWHDLKLEFSDAVKRASYLCKTSQKSMLPNRFVRCSFNITRMTKSKKFECEAAA